MLAYCLIQYISYCYTCCQEVTTACVICQHCRHCWLAAQYDKLALQYLLSRGPYCLRLYVNTVHLLMRCQFDVIVYDLWSPMGFDLRWTLIWCLVQVSRIIFLYCLLAIAWLLLASVHLAFAIHSDHCEFPLPPVPEVSIGKYMYVFHWRFSVTGARWVVTGLPWLLLYLDA